MHLDTIRLSMRIVSVLFLSLFFLSVSGQNGSTAFSFLSLPTSAHIDALGGENITVIDNDLSLIQSNPALLGSEMNLQLSLNYLRYAQEVNYGGAVFAKSLSAVNALAISVNYLDYGRFVSSQPDGSIDGDFSAKDVVVSALYAHDFSSRWRGGVALKFISSNYERYTSMALGVDAGVNYYDSENGISLSLVSRNMGGQLTTYNDNYERMPWDVALGFSILLQHAPVRFSVTANHLTKWDLSYQSLNNGSSDNNETMKINNDFIPNLFRHLVFGVDILASDKFTLSVGYNYKRYSDMKNFGRSILSGFSGGVKFQGDRFGIGASVSQHHPSAMSFMVSLSTVFGPIK